MITHNRSKRRGGYSQILQLILYTYFFFFLSSWARFMVYGLTTHKLLPSAAWFLLRCFSCCCCCCRRSLFLGWDFFIIILSTTKKNRDIMELFFFLLFNLPCCRLHTLENHHGHNFHDDVNLFLLKLRLAHFNYKKNHE